jgi:Ribonuclease G/E
MSREIWIEERIGETRAALVEDGRIAELRLRRWSDAGRAFWGDVFVARAGAFDARQGGLFVPLGAGPDGFLPWRGGGPPPPTEGAALVVGIAREAVGDKGPGLVLFDETPEPGPVPRRLRAASLTLGWTEQERPAGPDEAGAIRDEIGACLHETAPIPGGGLLTIEPTAALIAIDVDADRRRGPSDRAKFLRELNRAAAAEAARQIRLRDLAGLIAVDFVGRPRAADAQALCRLLRDGLQKGPEPGRVETGLVSAFGLLDLARERRRRSLAELCLRRDGAPTDETLALEGLHRLAAALETARGREAVLRLAPRALSWLETDAIAWRKALAARGGRFHLEASTREEPEVHLR